MLWEYGHDIPGNQENEVGLIEYQYKRYQLNTVFMFAALPKAQLWSTCILIVCQLDWLFDCGTEQLNCAKVFSMTWPQGRALPPALKACVSAVLRAAILFSFWRAKGRHLRNFWFSLNFM